jgi:putative hemolysin
LIRITRPIAWIVTVTSQLFERIVNRRVKRSARVTEADILTLVAEGIRIGSLDERETQFVKNALRLSDLQVKDVMTPIHQADAIDVTWKREKVDSEVRRSERSYLFAYRATPDSPVGVLRARDWLSTHRKGVEQVLQPIETIGSDASAVSLFELLQRQEIRMVAVVEDERTIGLVTLNDAVSLLQHGG